MANQGIIHFKETLNLLIPEFTTLGKNPVLTTNDNPLESSFMQGLSRSVGTAQEKIKTSPALTSVLAGDPELAKKVGNLQTSGVLDRETIDVFRALNAKIDEGKLTGLDAGTKTMITSMASIVSDFDSLDAESKEKISTAQRLFRRTDATNIAGNTQQAKAMLDLNRRYLGLEPSSSDPAKVVAGAHVDEKLALALREQMKELKKQYPDADFEPLKFDQRAVTFLKGLREKQMKDAGVDQSNLNQTLLNLWMMQNTGKGGAGSSAQTELGKTSALFSAMEYISDGKLSGGTYTSRPTVENSWDKGWTDHQSPDHFFNPKVYVELLDNTQKNPGEVKVSTLLSTTGNVRQNENLDKAIEKLRQDLKDPAKLDNAKQITSMIDQIDRYKRDPKAFDTTLTKEQVGILAVEILALQAKELCIDEKDVNKAIRSGKMATHLADLSLVDDGLGTPATLKHNDKVGEELAYRSNKFAERFGVMSDEQSRYAADQLKRLNPTMNTNWINANHQSPTKTFSMFSIMSGQVTESPELMYNKMRERYLLDLNERLQKSACAADAKPAPTSTAQAPAATVGAASVPAGGATATGSGSANVGCVANATGPCAPEKPPEPAKTDPVGCVAGATSGCKTDFAGASSDNATTAAEMVKSNIVDATGNAAEPLPEAHTLPQPQRTPAVTSGAP